MSYIDRNGITTVTTIVPHNLFGTLWTEFVDAGLMSAETKYDPYDRATHQTGVVATLRFKTSAAAQAFLARRAELISAAKNVAPIVGEVGQ